MQFCIDIYPLNGKILLIMNATLASLFFEAKAKPQPASAPSVIGFVGSVRLRMIS